MTDGWEIVFAIYIAAIIGVAIGLWELFWWLVS